MRAVVQRVRRAGVGVGGEMVGSVGQGLCVLAGIGAEDTEQDLAWMAEKIANLRVFEDENEKMNLSVRDIGGSILAVSQFTLYGDCRKGNRPSFVASMPPDRAQALYERFVALLRGTGVPVQTGVFRAHMLVEIENDGPVTLLLDSQKLF